MDYIQQLRQDFPILHHPVHGKKLAYLDNAATTQKPQTVIDCLNNYYCKLNANVHRGLHYLSDAATDAYEMARGKVQKFINAEHPSECIFVRGTTEAINLVATSFGQRFVHAGDEVLITGMEHHSNIVPWKLLCERVHAKLVVLPLTTDAELDLTKLNKLLTAKTKIVAVTHVSNALGTINPIKKIIQKAHAKNIPVLIDGAQAAAHLKIDVQDLDCDFYACSAHKMFGPMGVGALYAKQKWLDLMPPYQGGGEMIEQVTFTKITYAKAPQKFEAGTPAVADAIAWGAAIDYLQQLDKIAIAKHEQELLEYANHALFKLGGIKFYGTSVHKVPIVSFTLDNIHPHDIGTIVNESGVAIRTGHHCNMPLMDFLQISGTSRASFAFYNTVHEIDQLCTALQHVQKVFHGSR